jgi:hypothetical protein
VSLNLNTAKQAAVTTVMVLAVIYALNQVAITRGLVQKALN